MRPPRNPSPPQRRRFSGRGFTMIELMVVIVIIAILIGLLLPAIGSVRSRVRHAAVQAEIGRLSSAIVSFKIKYGSEPPSQVTLRETGGTNGANWDTRSRALIRQLWPQFNFAGNYDINGDGDMTDSPTLGSGESLVFFLGGLPAPSGGGFALLPFSRNPQDPFSRATNANRDKAVYDFDPSRLMDLDSNGLPEFKDSYPSQTNPILYFSSYDGNGYRLAEYPGRQGPRATSPFWPQHPELLPIGPYKRGTSDAAPSFNPNSFQLISPGVDKIYGPCGPLDSGATSPLPAWTRADLPPPYDASEPNGANTDPYLALRVPAPLVVLQDRNGEGDNITNFGNGPLVP